jgi:predicted O-methyltransferase YrrM
VDKRALPSRIIAYDDRWDLGLQQNNIILPGLEDIGGPGEVTLPELCLLAYTVKRFDVKRFFEIGTYRGTTAFTIAANMNPGGHVYTLDVPAVPYDLNEKDRRWCKPEIVGEVFRNKEGHQERITQLWGNSKYFDFGGFYGKMDMVFVDGEHSHEATVSDLKNAMKMIKPNGIVACHDFSVWYPEVLYAVGEAMDDKLIYTFSWTTIMMYGNTVGRLFND